MEITTKYRKLFKYKNGNPVCPDMLYLLESDCDKSHPIDAEELKIGRGRSNNLKLDSETVSKEHAIIWANPDKRSITVSDNGSKHGTRVSFSDPPKEWVLIQHKKDVVLKIGQSIHFGRFDRSNQKYFTIVADGNTQRPNQGRGNLQINASMPTTSQETLSKTENNLGSQENGHLNTNKIVDKSHDEERYRDLSGPLTETRSSAQSQGKRDNYSGEVGHASLVSTNQSMQTGNSQGNSASKRNINPQAAGVTLTLQYGALATATPISVHIGPGSSMTSTSTAVETSYPVGDKRSNVIDIDSDPHFRKSFHKTYPNPAAGSDASPSPYLSSDMSTAAIDASASNARSQTMPAPFRRDRVSQGPPLTPVREGDSVEDADDSLGDRSIEKYGAHSAPLIEDSLDGQEDDEDYPSPRPSTEKSPLTMRFRSQYMDAGEVDQGSLGSLLELIDRSGLGSDDRLEVERVRDSHSELVRQSNKVLAGLTDFQTWRNSSKNVSPRASIESFLECKDESDDDIFSKKAITQDDVIQEESNDVLTLLKRKHDNLLHRSVRLSAPEDDSLDEAGAAPALGSSRQHAATTGSGIPIRSESGYMSGKKMRMTRSLASDAASSGETYAKISKKSRSLLDDEVISGTRGAIDGAGGDNNRRVSTQTAAYDRGSAVTNSSHKANARSSRAVQEKDEYDSPIDSEGKDPKLASDPHFTQPPLQLPRAAVLERLKTVVQSLDDVVARSLLNEPKPVQIKLRSRENFEVGPNLNAIDSSLEKLDSILLNKLIPNAMRRSVRNDVDSAGHLRKLHRDRGEDSDDSEAKNVLDLVESVNVLRGLREYQMSREPVERKQLSNAASSPTALGINGNKNNNPRTQLQEEFIQDEISSYLDYGVQQVVSVADKVMRSLERNDQSNIDIQPYDQSQVSKHENDKLRIAIDALQKPSTQLVPSDTPHIPLQTQPTSIQRPLSSAHPALVAEVAGDGEVRLRLVTAAMEDRRPVTAEPNDEEFSQTRSGSKIEMTELKQSHPRSQLKESKHEMESNDVPTSAEIVRVKEELESLRALHAQDKTALLEAQRKAQELLLIVEEMTVNSKNQFDCYISDKSKLTNALHNSALSRLVAVVRDVEKRRDPRAYALNKWRSVSLQHRSEALLETQTQVARLRVELGRTLETIHMLGARDELSSSLLAERAMNRELSATNADLQRRLSELYEKLMEAASLPALERQRLVRDVLLSREDELVRCRRECRALRDVLGRMRQPDADAAEGRTNLPLSRRGCGVQSTGSDDDTLDRPESQIDIHDADPKAIPAQPTNKLSKKLRTTGILKPTVSTKPVSGPSLSTPVSIPTTFPPKVAQQIVLLELSRLQEKSRADEQERAALLTQIQSDGQRLAMQEQTIQALQQRVFDKQLREVQLENLLVENVGRVTSSLFEGSSAVGETPMHDPLRLSGASHRHKRTT